MTRNIVIAVGCWLLSLFFLYLIRMTLQDGYVSNRGGQIIERKRNPIQFWSNIVALIFGVLLLIVFGIMALLGKFK
jgi:hypothetical protein